MSTVVTFKTLREYVELIVKTSMPSGSNFFATARQYSRC